MTKTRTMAAALLLALLAPLALGAKSVHVIEIDGVIDPGVANFVGTSIAAAHEAGSQALIIELDTPGGMLDSTKEIVQAFLDSEVPVVVYVFPQGASATSAGMMVTIAGHVAVMAPGTNIGAAHPVMISSEGQYQSIPKDDVMMEKATNDTVGWVRSICDVRGRNAEWAEKAVTESKSIPAKEAVEKKVVDGMAEDLDDLISEFLPGRKVKMKGQETLTLDTRDAQVIELAMSLPQKLQHFINNPSFIYVLMLIGFLGVAIEFKSPGLIFPAVIGVGCILFALFGPSLPINYAGLMLILIGFAFLIAEIFITSYGLLSIAGVAALVFGSLMLFDKPEVPDMDPFLVPDLAPSWWLIAAMVTFVVATVLIFGGAIYRAHRHKVMTGYEELAGTEAVAETDIGPQGGKIFVHGEYWNATSDLPVAKGEKVMIKSVTNLLCRVEKIGQAGGPQEDSG